MTTRNLGTFVNELQATGGESSCSPFLFPVLSGRCRETVSIVGRLATLRNLDLTSTSGLEFWAHVPLPTPRNL